MTVEGFHGMDVVKCILQTFVGAFSPRVMYADSKIEAPFAWAEVMTPS